MLTQTALNGKTPKGIGQVGDDVAGHDAVCAEAGGGRIACEGMQTDAETGRVVGRIALREEAEQNACEHIAAASRGQTAAAPRADADRCACYLRRIDARRMALSTRMTR